MQEILLVLTGIFYLVAIILSLVVTFFSVTEFSPKAKRSFLYFVVFCYIWFIFNSLSLYFPDSKTLTLLMIQGTLFSTSIGTVFLVQFYNNLFKSNYYISEATERFLVFIGFVVGFIAFTNLYINDVLLNDGVSTPIFSPFFVVYFGWMIIVSGLSAYLIFKYSRNKLYAHQNRWRFLVFSLIFTLFITISTNIFLVAIFKAANSVVFGPPFMLFYIFVNLYILLVRRIRDVNITLRLLTRYLQLFIIYAIVIIISIYLTSLITKNIFISFIPAAVLLLFVGRFTYQFTNPYEEVEKKIKAYSAKISVELNIQVILGDLNNILNETIKPGFVEFVLYNKKKIYTYEINPKTKVAYVTKRFNKVFIYTNKLWDKLNHHSIFIASDFKQLLAQHPEAKVETYANRIQKLSDKYDIDLIAPLNRRVSLNGIIILGKKTDYSEYTQNDLEILENILQFTSVAISRALLYKETKDFAAFLEDKVEQRTKELQRSNEKLEQVVEQLKTVDKAKSEFISIASHQLRTPISIIRGYISMLMDGDFGKVPEEQRPILDKAQSSVKQLINIVEDILNASRIEQGRLIINYGKFDIIESAKTVVNELRQKAYKKGLKLDYSTDVESYLLDGDKNKLFEVIVNIVDNAINYTMQGSVHLHIAPQKEKRLLISVKDTGIGIPKDKQDKIFQRFSRLENAQKVRPDGTGIGLYIAKTIVEAHKGQIWFESVENEGTTFFVELPQENPNPTNQTSTQLGQSNPTK
jgi:signal transduction histidine kinase